MPQTIKGTVENTTEKFGGGLCIAGNWYNYNEASAKYKASKGDLVEIQVEREGKRLVIQFIKVLPQEKQVQKSECEEPQVDRQVVQPSAAEREEKFKKQMVDDMAWAMTAAHDAALQSSTERQDKDFKWTSKDMQKFATSLFIGLRDKRGR